VKGYQPEKSNLDKVEKAATLEKQKTGLAEIEKLIETLNAALGKEEILWRIGIGHLERYGTDVGYE